MGTDLGANWYEATGVWGKTGGELIEDFDSGTIGTANALLICTQRVPARSAGEMYVQIEVPEEHLAVGDIYRVYAGCPSSTSVSGAVLATFTYVNDSPKQWEIAITPSSGDESTTTEDWQGGAPNVTLKVCIDHEISVIRAGIAPAVNTMSSWSSEDPGTGRYAAIGHNNTGHLNVFDNFEMGELRRPGELCEACFCMCNDAIPMPPNLTGMFIHTDDDATKTRASCLDGLTWAMVYDPEPTVTTWIGTFTGGAGDYGTDETINFRLVCGENGVFTLYTEGHGCIVTGGNNRGFAEELYPSDCDPIGLIFGPFTLNFAQACNFCYDQNTPPECQIPVPEPDEPPCHGEFYIIFTEVT